MTNKKHLRKLPHKPTVREVISHLPKDAHYSIEGVDFSEGYIANNNKRYYMFYQGKRRILSDNKYVRMEYGDAPVYHISKVSDGFAKHMFMIYLYDDSPYYTPSEKLYYAIKEKIENTLR